MSPKKPPRSSPAWPRRRLQLASRIEAPLPDVYLVASAKEEVGAIGALYFTQHQAMDALISLEICPIAPEYLIKDGPAPVLLAEDARGIYDVGLNESIRRAACLGFPTQNTHGFEIAHLDAIENCARILEEVCTDIAFSEP